ncbi:MAG: class II aldolase/adducin family protein [Fimbriimonadaceae bacterium]|nr:class II aldolase/adducin family protein [Chthonomonadaceae bacterium]MCO5295995.1 class II aldolase/adducin family protein [Fimbriimonadaceae bacterium]
MTEQALREAMCRAGRLLWERGLVGASEGNLSARLEDGSILCTPSGGSKGHLEPESLVVLDPGGRPVDGGRPSSEIRLHLRALARRPDCGAVVHAHPPTATAFAVAGRTIPDDVLPEAMIVLGPVALIPFAMAGTDALPDAMEDAFPKHKTFLLGHHGAVTLGRDLEDAVQRMETLERIAVVLMRAEALGGAKPLPAEAFEALKHHLHGRL